MERSCLGQKNPCPPPREDSEADGEDRCISRQFCKRATYPVIGMSCKSPRIQPSRLGFEEGFLEEVVPELNSKGRVTLGKMKDGSKKGTAGPEKSKLKGWRQELAGLKATQATRPYSHNSYLTAEKTKPL